MVFYHEHRRIAARGLTTLLLCSRRMDSRNTEYFRSYLTSSGAIRLACLGFAIKARSGTVLSFPTLLVCSSSSRRPSWWNDPLISFAEQVKQSPAKHLLCGSSSPTAKAASRNTVVSGGAHHHLVSRSIQVDHHLNASRGNDTTAVPYYWSDSFRDPRLSMFCFTAQKIRVEQRVNWDL